MERGGFGNGEMRQKRSGGPAVPEASGGVSSRVS